jgi:tetratricopeptide (TPR) repeat protein
LFSLALDMASSESNLHVASELPHRSREAVLLVSLLLLLVLFAFTAFFSRMYKKHIHVLADDWFARGEASFQAGDFKGAAADYRNGLAFSPDNPKFQFHLAKALATAGREEEAKAYFLTLLSEAPGSGEINLELARIAVRQGQMADALRYFQGAIYGEWTGDPVGKRWQVRKEFCEYLMDQGAFRQVEGELIALVDNTPLSDEERLKEVGGLLVRAQLWTRALSVFRSALALNKQDADALLGAGTAAFQLGNYAQALEFFNQLPREKKEHSDVSAMMETSRLVIEVDPFRPGLPLQERAEKAAKAVASAQSRLQDCAGKLGGWNALPSKADGLQKLHTTVQSLRKDWSAPNLRAHPDRIDAAMAWVFEVEIKSSNLCGTAQDENRALWLLGRGRGNGGK